VRSFIFSNLLKFNFTINTFFCKISFEEFLKVGASKLNNSETYKELSNRSKRNGYKIESVIFNGYSSSKELQEIQDNAIEQRTKLRLNAEIDEQRNKLIDLKLKSDSERLNLENDLNRLRFEFQQKLAEMNASFQMAKNKMANEYDLKLKEEENNLAYEKKTKIQKVEQDYLASLKEIGVNIKEYELELTKSKNNLDALYELVN